MNNDTFEPSVRYTNGLTLWFKSKHDVEVRDHRSIIIVSRWFVKENNCYRDRWKPFCETLYRHNSLHTIWDVMDLASKYGLDMYSSYDRVPKPIPAGILVRPAIYQYKRRKYGDIQTKDVRR